MHAAQRTGDVGGAASVAGSGSAWRAIRRAVTPRQVSRVGLSVLHPPSVP